MYCGCCDNNGNLHAERGKYKTDDGLAGYHYLSGFPSMEGCFFLSTPGFSKKILEYCFVLLSCAIIPPTEAQDEQRRDFSLCYSSIKWMTFRMVVAEIILTENRTRQRRTRGD